MNVYDTKQIYYSMLYKTYIDYDIARRNYIWRLFEIIIKWRRLMFVLFLLDSSRHLCSFGKWKKCKKYMRHLSGTFSAFVVWLSRFFWALIYQRKWKETLSRWQKRQELHNYYLPSMIDDFEKKVLCLQGSYTFINNFWTARLWQNRLFYTFLQLETIFARWRDIPCGICFLGVLAMDWP